MTSTGGAADCPVRLTAKQFQPHTNLFFTVPSTCPPNNSDHARPIFFQNRHHQRARFLLPA